MTTSTASSTVSVAGAFTEIPWLAVAIATVVSAGLGALYFMVLVPTAYTRVLGRQGKPAPAASPADTLTPVLCVLATVITSSLLIIALTLQTIGPALVFAVVVGLGYQLSPPRALRAAQRSLLPRRQRHHPRAGRPPALP